MDTRTLIDFIAKQPLAKFDPYRFAVEIAAAQKEACAVKLDEMGQYDLAALIRSME
jgi:hypothetical protein